MVNYVAAAQFLSTGLSYAGFDPTSTCPATNGRHFQSIYGAHPEVCETIFVEFQTTNCVDGRIDVPNADYFLMALNWATTYPSEATLAGTFRVTEETARTNVWIYIRALSGFKEAKIVWPFTDATEEIFIFTVDAVHCRIQEPPADPGAKWKSHKLDKAAAVTYELAMSIFPHKLVWINGPFPASTHDITVFRQPNGLMSHMPTGKLGLADKGYSGEPVHLAVKSNLDAPQLSEFKRQSLARHEAFNGRLKRFGVLRQEFRHALHKHPTVFEAICVIAAYEVDAFEV